MDQSLDLVIPADSIERDIADASTLLERLHGRLLWLRETGQGRLRLGDRWETHEEATRRLEQVVEHHAGTLELLKGFRAVYPESDH